MKKEIHELVLKAFENSVKDGKIAPVDSTPVFVIENPKTESHGDFSTNIAMVLAPLVKRSPREIAQILQSSLQADHLLIEKVEVAGPGFINFFMQARFWLNGFKSVLKSGIDFGKIE
jgi:arginyl-tRNA synthetase